jgi:hypothetical protein
MIGKATLFVTNDADFLREDIEAIEVQMLDSLI